MKRKLALILGIRPDVIRAARIIKLLDEAKDVDLVFLWSGQHYSDNMKDVFFRELGVRAPDVELGCRGETDGELVGSIVSRLHAELVRIKPDAAVFLGDTNTVTGSLAAAQLNIPVVHIEGCMRSYDWVMPEEKYRTMIDHLSDVIYAYLPAYRDNGILEGIAPHRIVLTGNPIVDIIQDYYLPRRGKADAALFKKYGVEKGRYLFMTSHRRENVMIEERLRRIIGLAGATSMPVVFPAGYLTQRMLKQFGVEVPPNVKLCDPIGYMDCLYLMDGARYVMTDSGTVVEEACVIGKASIQMRWSTERPEVYEAGASVRFDPRDPANDRADSWAATHARADAVSRTSWTQPFGDGRASDRIVQDLVARAETADGFRTHRPQDVAVNVGRSRMAGTGD